MFAMKILLAIIFVPVAMHLIRILVMPSPGHSRMLSPVLTGTSSIAVVSLLVVLLTMATSGDFEPFDMPQRPDLQHESGLLGTANILPF